MGNWKRPADDMYDEEDEHSHDYVPDRGNRPRKQKRCADRKRKDPSIPWSEEDMEQLIALVRERLDPDTGSDALVAWSDVAAAMGNRNAKQCREKYRNDLRPDISKGPWSAEEDYVLALAHSQLGNKWSDIATFLPRRAENTIKNHWYATLRAKADSRSRTFLWLYGTLAAQDPSPSCLRAAKEQWADHVSLSNGTLPSVSDFEVKQDHFTNGPGAVHNKELQKEEMRAVRRLANGNIPLRSATARAAALSTGGPTGGNNPPARRARTSQDSTATGFGHLGMNPLAASVHLRDAMHAMMPPRPVSAHSVRAPPPPPHRISTGAFSQHLLDPLPGLPLCGPPSPVRTSASCPAPPWMTAPIPPPMHVGSMQHMRMSEPGDASCMVAFQMPAVSGGINPAGMISKPAPRMPPASGLLSQPFSSAPVHAFPEQMVSAPLLQQQKRHTMSAGGRSGSMGGQMGMTQIQGWPQGKGATGTLSMPLTMMPMMPPMDCETLEELFDGSAAGAALAAGDVQASSPPEAPDDVDFFIRELVCNEWMQATSKASPTCTAAKRPLPLVPLEPAAVTEPIAIEPVHASRGAADGLSMAGPAPASPPRVQHAVGVFDGGQWDTPKSTARTGLRPTAHVEHFAAAAADPVPLAGLNEFNLQEDNAMAVFWAKHYPCIWQQPSA